MLAAQPLQRVVVRLPDEARVTHERHDWFPAGATDMACEPDTIRARFDRIALTVPFEVGLVEDGSGEHFPQRAEALDGGDGERGQVALITGSPVRKKG
jgi:hypothetical protein